jgi:proliferating cell nuclear antigen
MSETARQTRLLGDLESDVAHIETEGRVIRPALGLLSALVDECRLQVSPDGLSVTAVDPANVALVDLTIHARAFESFSVAESFRTGLVLDSLESSLRQARKGARTSDPVSLDVSAGRTVVEVEREYSEATVTYADEVLGIDPNSIREEPTVPGLELPATATVPMQALADGVSYISGVTDHVLVSRDGDALRLAADGDEDTSGPFRAVVSVSDAVDCPEEQDPGSWLSLDYVADAVNALDQGLVDGVTMDWGENFPVRFAFERTDADGTLLYEGEYMISPRVKDGDPE